MYHLMIDQQRGEKLYLNAQIKLNFEWKFPLEQVS